MFEEIPAAIQWHEGMLLTPQHFQQSQARHEMLLQYSSLSLAPFAWGVREFKYDLKLLKSGVFRLLELEAIMPDGTLVSHRSERDPELSIDLAAQKEGMRLAELAVHVALPARNSGGVRGGLLRYESVEGDVIVDENTGDGDLRIPRLRPVLSLFAAETPSPKYESFPLVKVRFEDENYYLADYIPPIFAVNQKSQLGQMCSQLAARVREKATFISEQVRAPSAVLDMPMLLESKLRVQSLVAGLPPLEALLASGVAHPLTLYISLCQMAGYVCGLSGTLLPPVFAPYNHRDLRASFGEVIRFCSRMITEGVPESYRAITLRFSDGVFSGQFEPDWKRRRLVLGFRVPSGAGEREVRAWGEECLIGSSVVIQSLRERRILGAGRAFLERDQDLVPVRGVILFRLDADSEYIRPGEALQILNFTERPGATRPLEIVLYVKQVDE